MKIAREGAANHKFKVLNESNISNEFEKKKCTLDDEFKNIEDLLVSLHLKTKPMEKRIARECLDMRLLVSVMV